MELEKPCHYLPEPPDASEVWEHFSSRNILHHHVEIRVVLVEQKQGKKKYCFHSQSKNQMKALRHLSLVSFIIHVFEMAFIFEMYCWMLELRRSVLGSQKVQKYTLCPNSPTKTLGVQGEVLPWRSNPVGQGMERRQPAVFSSRLTCVLSVSAWPPADAIH